MGRKRTRVDLYRFYRRHEERHLRAYRRGHVTAAEYQYFACLAAITAYSLERRSGRRPPARRLAVRLRALLEPRATPLPPCASGA